MPDVVTHYYFGRKVLAGLPEQISRTLDVLIFDRACQGPDPWSTLGFYGGKNKKYAERSRIMHQSKAGEFLLALTRVSKQDMTTPIFAVLAGSICHYCLDKLVHPYIICKGGEYDGTEATRAFSGGHVRLERSIDSYIIRNAYGKVPWRFSIPKQILSLKRYPESLRRSLDAVYLDVYGWERAFDMFNASLQDEARFYSLMQDPMGIIHYLLRPVSGGRSNYCMYSYYRRDTDSSVLDYLNESHSEWRHPYDLSLVSTASFFDLFEQAMKEATDMIRAAYGFIYLDENISLADVFGDFNYSTGLECEDQRNLEKPVCEPFVYRSRYWNS